MVYVFDSSFVGALIIPDEKDPQTDRLYTKIKNEDEKYTPNLLWYEIANIYKNLIRRKRYTVEEIVQFFPLLSALGLTTDFETGAAYSRKIWGLCNDYNLSAYDAAYLELAERKKAVLCTLDENLINIAKKHRVTVIQ
ncbi:MAG: type II toxin-antitoxin system VapC family toxin [Treponema sp.]|nr:type II toxin-antitoxin system VapC family toxin [Treponema sp.]